MAHSEAMVEKLKDVQPDPQHIKRLEIQAEVAQIKGARAESTLERTTARSQLLHLSFEAEEKQCSLEASQAERYQDLYEEANTRLQIHAEHFATTVKQLEQFEASAMSI
eukprot:7228351-Karenia_brevis.AAC.1